MRRRNAALFFSVAAGGAAAVILLGFWISGIRREPPGQIELPPSFSTYGQPSGMSGPPEVSDIPEHILKVDAGNVQEILRTQARPSVFSARYRTTWHYEDKSVSRQTRIHSGPDAVKVETLTADGRSDTHYLTDGTRLCFWEEDNEQVLAAVGTGDRNYDNFARIATYEVLLDLDPADILSADYGWEDGGAYLVVLTAGPVYNTAWWISLETRLLYRAELSEPGGEPAISVKMLEFSADAPDPGLFRLPDGRSFEEWLEDIGAGQQSPARAIS